MNQAQDNLTFRWLLTLPPVQTSASTALAIPDTPAPKNETGDRELDAVLWLRDCIKTAHPALIESALGAFKQIKTPAKVLEKRYTDYVARVSKGHFGAVMMTFGFADLEGLAKRELNLAARRHELLARFGSIEAAFKNTAAEDACKKALRGLKRDKTWDNFDGEAAESRFAVKPELAPTTLDDCLHGMAFWRQLYSLRAAANEGLGDPHPAGEAHDYYCFDMLARIAPRSSSEALRVFEHLVDEQKMGYTDTPAILRNLIAGGSFNTAQIDTKLWCVHVTGADDVHPMPSHAEALQEANALNAVLVRNSHEEGDPIMIAVATEWPHSAASHAAGVAIRAEAMRLRAPAPSQHPAAMHTALLDAVPTKSEGWTA